MGDRLVARALRGFERWLLVAPRGAADESGLPRGWVGPRAETLLEARPEARHVLVAGSHHPHGEAHRVVRVAVRIEGRLVGRFTLEEPGPFAQRLPLPAGLLGPLRVNLESEPFFVPDEVLHNGDARQLCFYLHALRFVA